MDSDPAFLETAEVFFFAHKFVPRGSVRAPPQRLVANPPHVNSLAVLRLAYAVPKTNTRQMISGEHVLLPVSRYIVNPCFGPQIRIGIGIRSHSRAP